MRGGINGKSKIGFNKVYLLNMRNNMLHHSKLALVLAHTAVALEVLPVRRVASGQRLVEHTQPVVALVHIVQRKAATKQGLHHRRQWQRKIRRRRGSRSSERGARASSRRRRQRAVHRRQRRIRRPVRVRRAVRKIHRVVCGGGRAVRRRGRAVRRRGRAVRGGGRAVRGGGRAVRGGGRAVRRRGRAVRRRGRAVRRGGVGREVRLFAGEGAAGRGAGSH